MSVTRSQARLKQKIHAAELRVRFTQMYRESGCNASRFARLINVSPRTLQNYLSGARGTPGLAIPAARWALLQLGRQVTLSADDSRL